MRNTLRLGFVIFSLAVWMPTASAVPVLDQEFDAFAAGANGGPALTPGQILYQTFTVGLGGTLASVELQAQQGFDPPTDDLVVSILGTSGGAPDPATVLGSVNVPPAAVPPGDFSSVPFFSVDLSGFGIAVAPGEKLAVRLSQASPASRYFWYAASPIEEEEDDGPPPMASGLYPGGEYFRGGDLVSIPTVSNQRDTGFRTFIEAAAAFAGDYNASGQVEQGDLNLVLQNWGVDTDVAGVPAGWVNDLPSGQIEQSELNRVLQNWGNTSAPDFSGSVVPEPTSLAMLGVGGLVLGRKWNSHYREP